MNFRKIVLYIYQLPQNILGLLVVLFSKAKKDTAHNIYLTDMNFGVSLGEYIILGRKGLLYKDILHERGHQKQSEKLGWLYLLVIGIPSIARNIYDRLFHRNWNNAKRIKWYYSSFPEKQADKLGGVIR